MTPTDRDRDMAEAQEAIGHVIDEFVEAAIRNKDGLPDFWHENDMTERLAEALVPLWISCPNLPPLFDVDDWLWVAQSIGYVDWTDHDFEVRHRMDQIIAKIIEYRAEDVSQRRGNE